MQQHFWNNAKDVLHQFDDNHPQKVMSIAPNLSDSVKLVFPNVELRMKPIAADSPINIHCLFDPSIAGELESRFFSNLRFEYNQNQYSATRSELIRLGRDFQGSPSLSEEEAFSVGLSQYVISFETLSNIFESVCVSRCFLDGGHPV